MAVGGKSQAGNPPSSSPYAQNLLWAPPGHDAQHRLLDQKEKTGKRVSGPLRVGD